MKDICSAGLCLGQLANLQVRTLLLCPGYSITPKQGGYDKVQCHVINSRIMRANKAKECNYGGWAGFLLNLNLPFQRFAMLLGSRERLIRESK